jgi:carbamate kinase
VVRKPRDNTFELVDSVIDKDRTAYLIAQAIKASHFFLLTNVPHASINFGKPGEVGLFDITVKQAKQYLAGGQFPAGSMGPKIEAAVHFAENTGGTAIITSADNILSALAEKAGTRIHL